MSYIEAAVMGRIGKPPSRRTSKAGNPYATLSIAVQDRGEEGPTWVNVMIFDSALLDDLPELVAGEKVYAEGPLRLTTWERNGETRTGLQLTARTFQVLDRIGRRRQPKRLKQAADGGGQAVAPPDGARGGVSGDDAAQDDFGGL